jgi:hypothetical protein
LNFAETWQRADMYHLPGHLSANETSVGLSTAMAHCKNSRLPQRLGSAPESTFYGLMF